MELEVCLWTPVEMNVLNVTQLLINVQYNVRTTNLDLTVQ